MKKFDEVASDESLEKATESLKQNGIDAIVVKNGGEAFKKVFELIPQGAEVMTMSSKTLEETGIAKEIDESGKYKSIRKGWEILDKSKSENAKRMQQVMVAPDWAIGSANAVTEEGQVMVASNTGSQLAAYVYGASHVVWVVGGQKVVRDKDEGERRIFEYVLPKESIRAREAYGLPETFHSNVSKLLIVNKEISPNRITLILVNEALGF